MQQSYRFTVTGRVQGVGFREAARRKAIALGLGGWVRNREDGGVEGQVTGGSVADLETFRGWLAIGPPSAQVSAVEWQTGAAAAEDALFTIRR
jgi:acylphosphatase